VFEGWHSHSRRGPLNFLMDCLRVPHVALTFAFPCLHFTGMPFLAMFVQFQLVLQRFQWLFVPVQFIHLQLSMQLVTDADPYATT